MKNKSAAVLHEKVFEFLNMHEFRADDPMSNPTEQHAAAAAVVPLICCSGALLDRFQSR